MAEPVATPAVAAGGLVIAAVVGEWLGVDADALLWGAAGGLVLMYFQQPTERWRALLGVAVAAVVAAAATPVVTPLMSSSVPAVPGRALGHFLAFLAGLLSQVGFDAIATRVRTWGDKGKGGGDDH